MIAIAIAFCLFSAISLWAAFALALTELPHCQEFTDGVLLVLVVLLMLCLSLVGALAATEVFSRM